MLPLVEVFLLNSTLQHLHDFLLITSHFRKDSLWTFYYWTFSAALPIFYLLSGILLIESQCSAACFICVFIALIIFSIFVLEQPNNVVCILELVKILFLMFMPAATIQPLDRLKREFTHKTIFPLR